MRRPRGFLCRSVIRADCEQFRRLTSLILDSVQTRFRLALLPAIVAVVSVAAAGQASAPASGGPNCPLHLAKVEDDVIGRLSALQQKKHKVSRFTHNKIARQIACSLSAQDDGYPWSAVLNSSAEGDLSRIIVGQDVGVGVWFAITQDHPEGAYWVVARPLPTKNPVWYVLSLFTDDPLLRHSRNDGTYPLTSTCKIMVH